MSRWRHDDDDDGGDPRTWCSRGTGTECSLRPWSVSTHSLRWPGPDVVIAALLPATVDAHTRVYNERMETILAYMSQRGFPRPLQRKVRAERAPRHRGGRSQSGRRG